MWYAWLVCMVMLEQTSFGSIGRVLWRVMFLLGVPWVPMLRYSNMVVLVSLVSKNDNLTPDRH